ncbi:hypothetical protein [Mycolicibacterium mengxianglii]|uniref:hypothetical protein n=1 Tax=Mycolicibacterium mengxianglii TaxID=2736649 RepID=UPI0018D03287|nr:hypothetical protein [Mycolicibacterium mengxianglii]
MTHQCDPSQHPGGGLLTLSRTYETLLAVMGNHPSVAIKEVDDCTRCRMLLTTNLAAICAGLYSAINPESRMGMELQLAAIRAALERGETETPPDGFQ